MVKPLMCTIYIEVNDGSGPKSKEYQAQVLDISIGGICLQEPRGMQLAPGSTLKACYKLIPDFGVLRFDLVIRHAFEVENRLGRASRRAGCEFLNLPSAGQQAVQKFMTKLERDRRSVLT
jgi:c-di-GMP-binding flagellar brake protein YcgR